MSKTTKQLEREIGSNPLDGYSVALQACIDVAKGDSKSRLRLDAAQMLLDNCAVPPWVEWDLELMSDDAD